MSERQRTTTHPDLEALRRSEPVGTPPRRPWLPRLTVAALVVGLLGAAYAVLAPLFFPPREVRVSPVRAVTGGDGAVRTGGFVTAAGWIEAYPYPVTVRPLVPGVLAELKVLEGSPVEKDVTVLATLRNVDLELALSLARAAVTLRESERAQAQTALRVARSLLEQKLPPRVLVAQHEGELAAARAEVGRESASRLAGEAALATAEVDLEAEQDLERAGGATPSALARARARVREQEEQVQALRRAEVRAQAELRLHEGLLALAREAVDDPRDLLGRVDDAASALKRADAGLALAQAELQVAQERLACLTVRAPITGVVLRLESAPGAIVGPQGDFKGPGEGAGSTGLLNRTTGAVCSLYDPARLQLRVDLPYADLPGIRKGTVVEIEAKALPGRTFRGTVDRILREADITQAKLQVKVLLAEPDAALRPEMLCTARLVVQEEGSSAGKGGPPVVHRVQVPSEALRGDAVFVYDPTGGGRARRVSVRVVRQDETWAEVEGDLGISSKVILDDVEDGGPVKVKR